MKLFSIPTGFTAWGTLALALLLTAKVEAQMQPRARLEGEWWPILLRKTEATYILKDGEKRKSDDATVDIQPADSFGPGSVRISNVQVDFDPLQKLSPKERAKAFATAFRYEADLTAAQDLENCYALLPYIAGGSIGTHLFPLGGLSGGKPKHITLELESQVDDIGFLHVFSQTKEILSDQVTKAYDLHEYFASLRRKVPGVPALALCKSAERFPLALSDDGSLLAMVKDRDSRYTVMVVDLHAMALAAEVEVSKHADQVSSLNWVSGTELVVVAGRDLKMVNLKDKTCTKVTDHVLAVLGTQKDRPWMAEIFSGDAVSQYDLHRGRESQIEQLEAGQFNVDEHGNLRVYVRYDGDRTIFRYRKSNNSPWIELDDTAKQPDLRFNVRADGILGRKIEILAVAPEADTLYVSSRQGSDKFQVATYSASEGVIKRIVARDPDYDLAISDEGGTRLLFRKGGAEMIGIVYEAARPRVAWLDPKFAQVQAAIDRQFPDHANLPLDWSVSGDTFIYYSSSDRDPGTTYVFRPFEGKLAPIFAASEALEGLKLAKTLPFDFRSRDGADIHAYVTYPPDPAPGLPPLVVYVHGGPTLRDTWRFDPMNQFLATRGYAVLQVNYRGSSGYGAAYQAAGLRSRLDTVVLDDLADGAEFLIKAGKVDSKRVAMVGGSFGGWATYMSLAKYPELYRAGVAIAAISHWKDVQRAKRWDRSSEISYVFWQSVLGGDRFSADEKYIDPRLRSAEIKQPIYVMHGNYDDIVPEDQAEQMVDALQKTNPNVRFMRFPLSSHTWWPLADQVTLMNEIGAFLKRTLPPGGT